MYAGTANWDWIRRVKQALSIPVIANGDVFSGQDAARILRYTGADGVMIARGVFGNPWIFQQAQAAIDGAAHSPLPPLSQRCDTAVRQFELAAQYKSEKIACLEARKHYAWYLKGVPYAGYWKSEISKISTLADVYRVTAGIKRELKGCKRRWMTGQLVTLAREGDRMPSPAWWSATRRWSTTWPWAKQGATTTRKK